MQKILSICEKMGVQTDECIPFGFYKAKIDLKMMKRLKDKKDGKLVLVTAINPTPAGEGKTTTTVGLADGLNAIGKNAAICIREASLGPK